MEGTITGEHGIGLYLRDVLQEEVGVNAIDMMRKVNFISSLLLSGAQASWLG